MNAATVKNSMKSGIRPGWFVWPVLLLGLLGLAASFYSFYKARQHAQVSTQLQQTLLTQHRLSSDIRKRWSSGQGVDLLSGPLDAFAQQHSGTVADASRLLGGQNDGEAQKQLDEVSERVLSALAGLREELPPTSVDPETFSANISAESDAGDAEGDSALPADGVGASPDIFQASNNLIETTATLRAILARDEGLPAQTESAGHLYQLAVSVANRLGVNTGDPDQPDITAARGPWLVFEQILQRMEAMIGTSEITKSDHIVLINDIRSQQLDLKDQFEAVENGEPVAQRPQNESVQAGVAATSASALNPGRTDSLARLASIGTRHSLLDDSLVAFESTIDSTDSNRSLWFTLGSLAGLLSAALLTLLCLGMYRRLRVQQQQEDVRDEAQEADILRLLDEIEHLAEGDLSTRASVTEGVTGSIADSVNYAVSELRRLVGTLSTSAERVNVAVAETGTSARQLANASAVQSREIGRSSAYIQAMSDTMSQLALRSAEAKAIALESVQLAGSGAESVSATAKTAESVRHQTAEASRMMRRLGDSSSQITRSVKLIDEAAEKTRLLAMNTTIKSRSQTGASNNDATTRGLADVADQVQGLANRLGQSAAEIETLVTVVQQDVKVALGNMQQIDREVGDVADNGANALKSLTQIKAVSERLSSVVKHIDERTHRQSAVIEKLSGNMNVINEVTRQSAHGLQLSASSLEDLRLMSTEMRDSVTEFTLPEKDRVAIAARTESIRAHEHVGAGSETMAVKPHTDDVLEGSLFELGDTGLSLDNKDSLHGVSEVMKKSASDTFSADVPRFSNNASASTTRSTTKSVVDSATGIAAGAAMGSVAGAAISGAALGPKDVTADFEQSMSSRVYADSASETFTAAEQYFDDSVADERLFAGSDSVMSDSPVDMDHDRTQVLGQQNADLTGNATEVLPRPAKSRDSDSSND